MNNIVERLKKDTNNVFDIIYRKISIDNKSIYIIFSDTLSDVNYINNYILKKITTISYTNDLFNTLYNSIPSANLKEVIKYDEIVKLIFEGFCILIIEDKYIAIEAKANLDRGINESENEVSLIGPKDAFTESFGKNIGLIRKRIRSNNLMINTHELGTESNTKIGLCYMKTIADTNLIRNVEEKILQINIDGIIDIGYIREAIITKESIFPIVNTTERPDTVCQALLEGKIAIIVDNTPFVMIIPTFFIDFFHTPDDYYQKPLNTTFVRIIRFLAFLISIFLPAYYISVTTHNPESIPLNLLINFSYQRLDVPFPGFIEAFVMIISFEILRESDARIPSKVGTSVSILGGLVLGEAAVSAGLVSPIMIIVIALSVISGLLFTSNSLAYTIRYYRFLLLILSAFFGLFGMFVGMMFLIIKLCSITSFGFSYTAPFAPFIKSEIKDSFIKCRSKKYKLRNPLTAKKNLVRGINHEKD